MRSPKRKSPKYIHDIHSEGNINGQVDTLVNCAGVVKPWRNPTTEHNDRMSPPVLLDGFLPPSPLILLIAFAIIVRSLAWDDLLARLQTFGSSLAQHCPPTIVRQRRDLALMFSGRSGEDDGRSRRVSFYLSIPKIAHHPPYRLTRFRGPGR
jgi:hypothetical protein